MDKFVLLGSVDESCDQPHRVQHGSLKPDSTDTLALTDCTLDPVPGFTTVN